MRVALAAGVLWLGVVVLLVTGDFRSCIGNCFDGVDNCNVNCTETHDTEENNSTQVATDYADCALGCVKALDDCSRVCQKAGLLWKRGCSLKEDIHHDWSLWSLYFDL